MNVLVREQQGWAAVQEEASQEQRVGDKEHRDSDLGHHPTAPKQEERGRSGDNDKPKLQ